MPPKFPVRMIGKSGGECNFLPRRSAARKVVSYNRSLRAWRVGVEVEVNGVALEKNRAG